MDTYRMAYFNSLAVFIFIMFFVWALGRRVLSFLGVKDLLGAEGTVFSAATGFGILGYVILFLGMAGLLYAPVVWSVFLAGTAVLLPGTVKYISGIRREDTSGERVPGLDKLSVFFVILLSVSVIVGFIGAMAPSFSNDSMAYHLTDAKYFAQNHTVGFIEFNSTNSLWPYLVEMYFTVSILLGLLPMAGLFHFALAVLGALAVFAFSNRFFDRRTGILAALIFFLVPGIFMEASETYVDLGAVLYNMMAVYSFFLFLRTKRAEWAMVCGMMCGLGMSVKYFAVVTPMILGICFSFLFLKERDIRYVKPFLLFTVFTVLFSFVWYLRQYIVLGNPMFPFFTGIFGTGKMDPEVLRALSEGKIRDMHGMSSGIKGLISLPWRITMFPHKFGGEQLGPIFLGFIPGIFLLRKVDPIVKILFVVTLMYFFLWFMQYQHLRFLLPIAPMLSIMTAYVICRLRGPGWGAGAAVKVFVLYAVFCFMLLLYHNSQAVMTVLGVESKDSYLLKNERSYCLSEYLNRDLPEASRVLVVGENNTFYIDVPNRRELYYWIYDGYDKRCSDEKDVLGFFEGEGFTHIVFAHKSEESYSPDEGSLRLTALLRTPGVAGRYLDLVTEITPAAKNSNGITYRVYRYRTPGEEQVSKT